MPRVPSDVDSTAGYAAAARVYGASLLMIVGGLLMGRTRLEAVAGAWLLVAGVVVTGGPSRWAVAWSVSRGDARRAFRVMRFSSMEAERRASAVLMAALALSRRDRAEPAFASDLAFLDGELARSGPRGSTGVAAHAMVRALHGNDETAGALFALIDASPRKAWGGFVRRLALTWLAADHARRGDFRALARRMKGRWPWPPRTPRWCWLMGKVAARLSGAGARPSDFTLRAAWILAPHRRRTRALVERALHAAGDPPALSSSSPPSPIDAALGAHRDVLLGSRDGREAARLAAFVRAGRAWDDVEAASTEEHRVLLAEARADLTAVALERALGLAAFAREGGTLESCYDAACESLLEEIGARCKRLVERADAERRLAVIDEWVEWANLRAYLERANQIGGERLRHLAYAEVTHAVCHYAVILHNERHHYGLSNCIFRWLLAEARWANDEEGIRLQRNNAQSLPGG